MTLFVSKAPTVDPVTRYSETIGNGSATSFTITHNLGTRDVGVIVRQVASPYAVVYASDLAQAATTNTVTVDFGAGNAPTSNQFRVTVFK